MAIKEITVAGKPVLVEVADIEPIDKSGFEFTAAEDGHDVADRIRDLVGVLTLPIQAAFEGSGAEEWEIEFNFGFSGEGGVPFFAKAESNASIKVAAKWKKGA